MSLIHENVNHVKNNTATKFMNMYNKCIDSTKTTVLPDYFLNSLDNKYFINRLIIESFVYHILLFIITYFILHECVKRFFNTKKLEVVLHIFLVSIVPNIYSYLSGFSSPYSYIMSNIISSITGYLVVVFLSKYLNYIMTQLIIVVISVFFMTLFNAIDVAGITYGLLAYTLVDKIGFEYIYKWIIYIVLSLIVLKIVLYINNTLVTYINSLYKENIRFKYEVRIMNHM